MKTKLKSWIWLIVLLVILALISVISNKENAETYPLYVADSPAPTGVKAIYTYLQKEMNASRWRSTPNFLPKQKSNQLLIMVEPTVWLEKEEWAAYEQYMRAGNTILFMNDSPNYFFNIKTKRTEFNKSNIVYDQQHKAYKADVSTISRLESERSDEVLLTDEYGTVALKRSFGKGQLIVAVTPYWFTNDSILEKDHLDLVFNLINAGNKKTIVFDDHIHGTENGATLLDIYPRWIILIFLQGSLILILLLWYQGKRFGPIFSPREETVRFSDEGIRALSAWYLRGKRFQDSLFIQADYVKLLLQERLSIPYSKEWNELGVYLERRKLNIPEISGFLSGLTAVLAKEKLSKQEYLLWSRKLDQLRKEVEEG